ncbi:MAG: diguanylate cyclase [Maritimibacter sp.]
MWVFETTIHFVDALALALVLAFVFGVIVQAMRAGRLRNWILGAIFGLGGVLVMMSPVEMANGIFVDLRAVLIVLVAGFVGAEAGIIALVVVSLARLGMGLPDAGWALFVNLTIGIAVQMVGAVVCRYVVWPRLGATWQKALALATVPHLFLVVTMNWSIVLGVPGLLDVLLVKFSVSWVGLFVAALVMIREEAQAKTAARLSDWAMRDELTNVLNRRGLNDACFGRLGVKQFAVICLDMDGFKAVNDAGGHAAGDAVLVEIATALKGAINQTAVLARVGGDEFVVVLPDASQTGAMAEARHLSNIIQSTFEASDNLPAPLTASIGVHWAAGETPLATMMQMADKALYRAKSTGKSGVVMSEEGHAHVALAQPTRPLSERV